MNSHQFLENAKTYLRIPEGVDIYDKEVLLLIESSLQSLKVAGMKTEQPNPLITEYVNCYVRRRMLQDTSSAFQNSEKEREQEILTQLTYGGLL